LHYAAKSGSNTAVRALLRNGADIKTKDQDERTPPHYASGAELGTFKQAPLKVKLKINGV